VVSGDSLLTSLHAARAVGMVGRPRKGKGSRARSALVLDFDDRGDGGKKRGKGKGKGRALGWFLAPTPTQKKKQQQQQQQGRKHMARYFPDRIPALAGKYDLCTGGPTLQAALTRGGGIDKRCVRCVGWFAGGLCGVKGGQNHVMRILTPRHHHHHTTTTHSLHHFRIVARATPQLKEDVVRRLKAAGRVVLMCGGKCVRTCVLGVWDNE
jgi:magnesium-transporting ATPase (P-type)